MFQQLFSSESACRRHGDAPFADERERYLLHCAEEGAARATLRMKANELRAIPSLARRHAPR